jgi:WD40 repeat protein
MDELDKNKTTSTPVKLGSVTALSYSNDGKYLFGVFGNRISIWDAHSGKKLRTFLATSKAALVSVAFSPINRTIAIGDSEGSITIYNETGKWVKELPK